MSKTSYFFWHLRSPSLFLSLLFNSICKLMPTRDGGLARASSESWCKANSLPLEACLERLGIATPSTTHSLVELEYKQQCNSIISSYNLTLGGPADLTFLSCLLRGSNAINVLETGVCYGWSSLEILLCISDKPDSKLVSIDSPYPLHPEHSQFVGILVPPKLHMKWTLIRQPDLTAISIAASKFTRQINLIHYDSDKKYYSRYLSYLRLWRLLGPGGIFVSDDVGDNLAFKHFIQSVNPHSYCIYESSGKYIGALLK